VRAVKRGSTLALAAALLTAAPHPLLAASSARSSSKDSASDRHHQRPSADNAPEPPAGDRDRDRIVRMQAALREIIQNGILRRMRVGVRVIEAKTGRLFYSARDATLMDPASNQKVLATTTALMRLGADWRFRTELTGLKPTPAASAPTRRSRTPRDRTQSRSTPPRTRRPASCRRACPWWSITG